MSGRQIDKRAERERIEQNTGMTTNLRCEGPRHGPEHMHTAVQYSCCAVLLMFEMEEGRTEKTIHLKGRCGQLNRS